MTRPHSPHAPTSATPLGATLAFTALASFAAGTATISIFFVTEREPYAFTALQQFALGLVVGVTYTLGALSASAVRRAFVARGGTSRGLVALLSVAMALVLLVPLVARGDASVFAVLAVYAPLTGCFWPLVEGFVSGGRAGAGLRSAIGRFNVTWSLTLLPGFLLPELLGRSGLSTDAVFLALALTHLASLACLAAFRREPGKHAEESHAAPRGYAELLRVHRVLHAMSYLVMYALSPYLPKLLARAGLSGFALSAVAMCWLAARSLGFLALERWHGWHGRWSVAVVGAALVLGGFGATLLAPGLPHGSGGSAPAVALAVVALTAFGAGLASLYTAALYYAFEVGGHEGGGSHEALIGLGYTIGPSCGLLVLGLERGGALDPSRRDAALLAVITALCAGASWYAWRRRRAPA